MYVCMYVHLVLPFSCTSSGKEIRKVGWQGISMASSGHYSAGVQDLDWPSLYSIHFNVTSFRMHQVWRPIQFQAVLCESRAYLWPASAGVIVCVSAVLRKHFIFYSTFLLHHVPSMVCWVWVCWRLILVGRLCHQQPTACSSYDHFKDWLSVMRWMPCWVGVSILVRKWRELVTCHWMMLILVKLRQHFWKSSFIIWWFQWCKLWHWRRWLAAAVQRLSATRQHFFWLL